MKNFFFSIFLMGSCLLSYDIIAMKRSQSEKKDFSIKRRKMTPVLPKKRRKMTPTPKKKISQKQDNEFPVITIPVNSNEELKKFVYWSGKIYAYPSPVSFYCAQSLDSNLFRYIVENTFKVNKKIAAGSSFFKSHEVCVDELLKEIPEFGEIILKK